MKFTELRLKGAYLIEVERLEDHRGFFGRLWCEKEMKEQGLNTNLVQSNISFSRNKGTLRGLHFQKSPYQETKLVRCTQGSIYDVIVDLRPDSPTYLEWCGVELSAENRSMIYVPEDFGHGFLTLEDNSEIYYLVTEFYNRDFEGGIRYDDPTIKIDWPAEVVDISERDMQHPDYNPNE